MKEEKFDLSDISIIPTIQSEISSRSECHPFYSDFMFQNLPLIASPMDTVVSKENYFNYIRNGIIPCIPRRVHLDYTANKYSPYFQSFGLCEIEKSIDKWEMYKATDKSSDFYNHNNVLIDIANGHIKKLVDIVEQIKEIWPKITLMVGNVAHPTTYKLLSKAGADFVRCSIGSGAGCTTAANVAVNYPLGSLISECRIIKNEENLTSKIVADGGMRGYDDIIKSLALGADYVMIGSLFNKSIESAGFNYLYGIKINNKMADKLWRYGFPIKKKYRGMSTKAVQRSWGKSNLVTAEGITKYQKVEYTLEQWTENFKDYLKSCMSYSGTKTLKEFVNEAEWIYITNSARKRFEK
jgi:IMP dehydrogenase/GMP reductase